MTVYPKFLAALGFVTLAFGQKPASHRVVVEVNVPGKQAYEIVLGNVANLRKAFAPQPVQIEVVCEGKGVDMLLKGGPVDLRVESARRAGTQFAACNNTLHFRNIDRNRLLPGVRVVDAGVAEVVRRQEAGWSYLKGAF